MAISVPTENQKCLWVICEDTQVCALIKSIG